MESEPGFGTWQVRMTPAERKQMRARIIRGGKLADEIREMANENHSQYEIPNAEQEIERKLSQVTKSETGEKRSEGSEKVEKSFSPLQKFIKFLKRIFLP